MAARYTPVSRDEMVATLTAERGWVADSSGRELVLVRKLATVPGAEIKVYTSIGVNAEDARGCGQDAIRVCAVMGGRGLVKAARVHRTQNWRDNLRARVKLVFDAAKVNARYRLANLARRSTPGAST